MERESYVRSLPYLHPSPWPKPASAQSSGGSYIRKLIFPRHVVSIEPRSSEKGDTLGPAFFLAAAVSYLDGSDTTDDEAEIGNRDPALCSFEASVLVPKSVAGVSPGASSTTLSQSSTTPGARKGGSAPGIPPPHDIADIAKQGTDYFPSPEPILHFRFGGNGTYCVDHSKVINISLEPGSNANSGGGDLEGHSQRRSGSGTRNGDGGDTIKCGRSVPSSVVISFDTCSFRIFQLGSDEEDNGGMEQLNYLRLIANELTASLSAAESFIAPPSPSTDKDSGDTQSSGRASLEEGGQCGIGLVPSSSGSEVKDQSQAKGGDDETSSCRLSQDGKEESQPSQRSPVSTDTSRKVSGMTGGLSRNSESARQSKRRRRAYEQSVTAIECIESIADPLKSLGSLQSRTLLGAGPGVEKHMSSLMTAAASSLSSSYETGTDSAYSTGEVERVLTRLDGAIADFFPVHTRVKQQRGGVSMSSPPGQVALNYADETACDSDELRSSADKMMKEYREAIIARHKSAILPSR